MTEPRPFRLLFLCTGNSARSILAEYLAPIAAPGRFVAESAGSHPKDHPNPLALRVLADRFGVDASGAKSQHLDAFLDEPFDLVVTVCDHARESCPIWPRKPATAHWGMPDPAAVEGSEEEKLAAFEETAEVLLRRLRLLAELPVEALEREALEAAAQAIASR